MRTRSLFSSGTAAQVREALRREKGPGGVPPRPARFTTASLLDRVVVLLELQPDIRIRIRADHLPMPVIDGAGRLQPRSTDETALIGNDPGKGTGAPIGGRRRDLRADVAGAEIRIIRLRESRRGNHHCNGRRSENLLHFPISILFGSTI